MRKFHGFFSILTTLSLFSLAGCADEVSTTSGGEESSAADKATAEDIARAQAELIVGTPGITPRLERSHPISTLEQPAVDADLSIPRVGDTWSELASLPAVTSAHSFALGVGDTDNKAHLGFMFTDTAYRTALASTGVLWDGGGVYYGDNVIALYGLTGTGAASTWSPYQGRYTPQTYSFSELRYDNGSSFYTTNYSSFGGLVSIIKDGGKGVYALTPAYTGSRAHSIAFNNHVLYALAAQQSAGLTLSTTPISSFGNLANQWVNKATIETAATGATLPKLIDANGTLVGAYLAGGNATIRATTTPSTVSTAANFIPIGSCTGAIRVDVAYAGGFLYAGCVSGIGALTVRKANISNLASVTWTTVTTGVAGAVSDLDLTGNGSVISLAVRQGTALRVFTSVTDTTPSFNQVLPGSFDLQSAAEGLVLSVCDLAGATKQVRTFLK